MREKKINIIAEDEMGNIYVLPSFSKWKVKKRGDSYVFSGKFYLNQGEFKNLPWNKDD